MKSLLTGEEIDPAAPAPEPLRASLAPLLAPLLRKFVKEPEVTLAATAFVVGLFAPKRERLCEDVVVACLQARARRADTEGAGEIVSKMTADQRAALVDAVARSREAAKPKPKEGRHGRREEGKGGRNGKRLAGRSP